MSWFDGDPADLHPQPRDFYGESFEDRAVSGYYDAQDGYAHLDDEPGPFTRYADPCDLDGSPF